MHADALALRLDAVQDNPRHHPDTHAVHALERSALLFTDEGGETFRISRNLDLFAFRGWDFARLSFRCMPGAVSWRSRRRRHHRPLFTLRIGNDRTGEPFGLLALTLRWTENGSI